MLFRRATKVFSGAEISHSFPAPTREEPVTLPRGGLFCLMLQSAQPLRGPRVMPSSGHDGEIGNFGVKKLPDKLASWRRALVKAVLDAHGHALRPEAGLGEAT